MQSGEEQRKALERNLQLSTVFSTSSPTIIALRTEKNIFQWPEKMVQAH